MIRNLILLFPGSHVTKTKISAFWNAQPVRPAVRPEVGGWVDEIRAGAAEMDFTGKDLNDHEIQLISAELPANTTLRALTVSGSRFGNQGVEALAASLKANTSLTSLTLCSLFGPCKFDALGAHALADALKVTRSLTSLTLSSAPIGDQGLVAIASSLTDNGSLERLHLSGCGISDNGARCLADALLANSALTSINLSANPLLGDEGVIALAEAIAVNRVVKEVVLDYKRMGQSAREAIVAVLPARPKAAFEGIF